MTKLYGYDIKDERVFNAPWIQAGCALILLKDDSDAD
jgi:hypothetical protein